MESNRCMLFRFKFRELYGRRAYGHKNRFVLQNNLLKYNLHGKCLLIVPNEMRTEVIRYAHERFYSGHFGEFKTYVP